MAKHARYTAPSSEIFRSSKSPNSSRQPHGRSLEEFGEVLSRHSPRVKSSAKLADKCGPRESDDGPQGC